MHHTQTYVTNLFCKWNYVKNTILLVHMLSQQQREECNEHYNYLHVSEPCSNKKHNSSSTCKQSKAQHCYDGKPKWMGWLLCLENWFAVFQWQWTQKKPKGRPPWCRSSRHFCCSSFLTTTTEEMLHSYSARYFPNTINSATYL